MLRALPLFELAVNDCYSWIRAAFMRRTKCENSVQTRVKTFPSKVFTVNTHVVDNKWKNVIAIPTNASDEASIDLSSIVANSLPPHFLYSFLLPSPDTKKQLLRDALSLHESLYREDTIVMVKESQTVGLKLTPSINENIAAIVQVLTTEQLLHYVKMIDRAYECETTLDEVEFYSQIDLNTSAVKRFLAIGHNGEPIACCGLFLNRQSHSAFLFDLVVVPDMHKRGIGTYMLNWLMHNSPTMYSCDIQYFTMTSVENAASIYTRIGFDTVGTLAYITKPRS